MGTNYYVRYDACPHCGRGDDELHIGKSSFGWCFSLRIYPEKNINTLEDWRDLLIAHPDSIYDEYRRRVSVEELQATITQRSHPGNDQRDAEFYRRNHAEPGPNNLIRHLADGLHCIGHGEGTYDYCVGDFS